MILVVPLLAALVACDAKPEGQPSPPPVTSTEQQVSPTPTGPPPSPEPVADGPCPYLKTAFVSEANGQRVGKVKVSADKPNPACFFYRSDNSVQLTVQVFVGDPRQAKALVDQAAPIATANKAEEPPGWKGGAESTKKGAVYAVAKAGTAVVVTTNQTQTIKAKRVAEQTIETLAL